MPTLTPPAGGGGDQGQVRGHRPGCGVRTLGCCNRTALAASRPCARVTGSLMLLLFLSDTLLMQQQQ